MKKEFVDIVKNDSNYRELVRKRTSFSLKLTALILIVYFSFILTIAFEPSLLSIPLYEGAVTTIGIPLGVFVILFAFVLTGVYTYKANGEFDTLSKKINQNLKDSLNE